MKKFIRKKTKKKLFVESSKFALDLAKLVFAGIVLAGVKELSINTLWFIGFGAMATLLLATFALGLFIKGNNK